MINVNFIGRLGADSETKVSAKGNEFQSFRVATDDFVNGERTTVWVSVFYSGELAKSIKQFLTKGKLVDVHGKQRLRLYQTKSGEQAIGVDVIADRVDFISVGGGQSEQSQKQEDKPNITIEAKIEKPQAQQAAAATATAQASSVESSSANDDDDLPF